MDVLRCLDSLGATTSLPFLRGGGFILLGVVLVGCDGKTKPIDDPAGRHESRNRDLEIMIEILAGHTDWCETVSFPGTSSTRRGTFS